MIAPFSSLLCLPLSSTLFSARPNPTAPSNTNHPASEVLFMFDEFCQPRVRPFTTVSKSPPYPIVILY